MKRIFGITLLCCWWIATSPLWAQPPNLQDRFQQRKAEIEQVKKELITTRINLKPEQEKKFWEVYDKYIEERLVLRKKIIQTRRSGFSMASTDAELEKNIEELFALRQKEIDMDKNYKALLLKIINIRQFAELYRTEQEFIKRVLEILRDKPHGGKPHPKPQKDDED